MIFYPLFFSGAPLLGAAETLKGLLTGLTFGLPIAEVVNIG